MARPTVSDVMREYAKGTVAYAKRVYGADLDYSEASLAEIDRILAHRTAEGLVIPAEMPEQDREDMWTYCKLLGGYVGEVIIRNLGGAWHTLAVEGRATGIALEVGAVRGSPPEAVWRTLTEECRSMSAYYDGLRVALGQEERSEDGGGLRCVTLPPPSTEPHPDSPPPKRRPWWRFWP